MVTQSACGGLRVVEFAGSKAGELVGMILSDYGADVVSVEPPGGSATRDDPSFVVLNRGKQSIALNLKCEQDLSEVRGLIRRADVVIVPWRPGVAERLELDYVHLRALNPALVYCAISGFGRLTGYASLPGYEHVVSAAIGKMCQLDDISGKGSYRPAGIPVFTAPATNSYGAAQLAVQGVLAALLERDRSGAGQMVETSLVDGAFATNLLRKDMRLQALAASAHGAPPDALRHRGVRLTFLTVQCKDGKWIQMCARQEQHFRNWLVGIGLGEVFDEPRYQDLPLGFKSIADADELEARIRERMVERTQRDWMKIFIEEFDVGADPFLEFDEFLEHPQMVENDRVVTINDPVLGETAQVGPIALMSETPPALTTSAPQLNQHGVLDWPDKPDNESPGDVTGRGGPLAGVTIVEVASFVAGPWANGLLAAMGARVIKIEPPNGDPFRKVGNNFAHVTHGKQSVVLNLKHERAVRILHDLLRKADVFMQNFRPGVAERLGFGYEAISRVAPQLVYVYGGAYGRFGPEAHRPAFHSTPNALCGGGILQAGRGNPPVDGSYPDPSSAAAVATSILLGLHARRRTGRGQYIETSMLASTGLIFAGQLVDYQNRPLRRAVDPDQTGYGALYRLYRIQDDWMFVGVLQEREWQRFARALGRPEWVDDVRFAYPEARERHDVELADLINDVFVTASRDEWVDRLQRAEVAAVPVRAEQGFPQFLVDNDLMTTTEHPDFGEYWRTLPLVRFSRSSTEPGPPCGLGEHTESVLEELGLPPATIHSLHEASVVKISESAKFSEAGSA